MTITTGHLEDFLNPTFAVLACSKPEAVAIGHSWREMGLVSLTQTPYGYAGGDPVNGVDPNGLTCWGVCTFTEGAHAIATGVVTTWHVTTWSWDRSGGILVHGVYVGAVGSWHFIYNDVGKGAASAGEWVYRHPAETADIALGVAAAATGVGAVVEAAGVASAVAAGATIGEASAGTLVLGGTAALTGGATTYLDNGSCNAGNTAACFGRDLGLVGTATGVISTLGALGPIAGLWSLETLPDAVSQGLGWFSATFGVGASVFDTTTTAAGASPCGS